MPETGRFNYRELVYLWRAIVFLYRHQGPRILWGLGVFITGLQVAAAAWLSKQIINAIVTPGAPEFLGMPYAVWLALAYSVLGIVLGYVNSRTTLALLAIRDSVTAVSDQFVMDKVSHSVGVGEFDSHEMNDRIRHATLGARALPSCFSGTTDVLRQLVVIGSIIGILMHYHPLVAAMVFVPAVPLFFAEMKTRANTFAALMNTSPFYRKMNYFLRLLLGAGAAKEVRAYDNGEFIVERYEDAARDVYEKTGKPLRQALYRTLSWGTLQACGVGGAYIWILWQAVQGRITIGDVVMYSGAVFYAGGAVNGLIQATSTLWTNTLEAANFFRYLDEERTEVSGPVIADAGGPARPVGDAEWSVRGLSYTYPGGTREVLKDVDFSIRAGEKLAIVGFNGAGKTTLVKLMLRLLEPQRGSIAFRGVDLKDWDLEVFRRNCGAVFQDFVQFRLSLYDNIALGATPGEGEACENAVYRAARLAGADEIANRLRDGYRTQLGAEFANGVDLSVGQWQKIALARCFIRGADVVFLDEPTAALDPKAEQEMFDRTLDFVDGRTVIVTSHRLAITPLVDRILVLDQGRLVEEGSHAELMARNGIYAKMYDTQARMYWPAEVAVERR
jgi:ATP-binding cassette subfamily B protein